MKYTGTFEITMQAEPPYETVEGVALGRIRIDKRFSGPLAATSEGHMLSARSAMQGSAGYVAIERVRGRLDGKEGSFVLQHFGIMTRGTPRLEVFVVPDSGTGELAGIAGQMEIRIEGGQHFYTLDVTLAGAAS